MLQLDAMTRLSYLHELCLVKVPVHSFALFLASCSSHNAQSSLAYPLASYPRRYSWWSGCICIPSSLLGVEIISERFLSIIASIMIRLRLPWYVFIQVTTRMVRIISWVCWCLTPVDPFHEFLLHLLGARQKFSFLCSTSLNVSHDVDVQGCSLVLADSIPSFLS